MKIQYYMYLSCTCTLHVLQIRQLYIIIKWSVCDNYDSVDIYYLVVVFIDISYNS